MIIYSKVFEGSMLRNELSSTRPTFKHACSNKKCLINHSYFLGILITQCIKRVHKDLRDKLAASVGAPEVPRLVMKNIKHLETQVKFLSKMYGVSSFPVLVACHTSFTIKI